MNAKIYGKRFSTDCFSDYFNDLASRINIGFDDYLEYQSEKATVKICESVKTKKDLFNELYMQYISLPFKEREEQILECMTEFFSQDRRLPDYVKTT